MSLRYQCRTCGEISKSWAAAERHADTHHGASVDLLGCIEQHREDARMVR